MKGFGRGLGGSCSFGSHSYKNFHSLLSTIANGHWSIYEGQISISFISCISSLMENDGSRPGSLLSLYIYFPIWLKCHLATLNDWRWCLINS